MGVSFFRGPPKMGGGVLLVFALATKLGGE